MQQPTQAPQTFATKRDANKYAYDNNLSNNIYAAWDGALDAWILKEFAPRLFHVGQQVKTVSFANWGTDQTLTVIAVKTIDPVMSSCPHHRIKAVAPNGDTFEAAERSFELA